jgi:hypothetical protein
MQFKSYILLVSFIFSVIEAYNINNFPIIKRFFNKTNKKKYIKKSYIHYNANNYAINKIILDDIADKIVGPKKNNTKLEKK